MTISAAAFKAECLKLMDEVERSGKAIVITKHGRPVAQLAPIQPPAKSLFGYMKNTVKISGDIVAPIEEEWSTVSGDEDAFYGTVPAKKRARKGK